MNILIVSATAFEIAPLLKYLEQKASKKSFFEFELNGHNIFPLVTGVGSIFTAFNMGRFKDADKLDLVVNMGLAGTFDHKIELGTVFTVKKDRFADIGVEERNGEFTDIFELDLHEKDQYPFSNGWIHTKESPYFKNLASYSGITVNRVHGSQKSIDLIREKYNADTESMEGAAFCYAAKMMNLEYIQLRAISNLIEPRNKESWKIELAIDNLNEAFVSFLENLAL